MREDLESILKDIAHQYRIKPDVLKSRIRIAPVARARQAAMYNMRMKTDCTLAEAGEVLGGRTPSTITYGFQKVAVEKERL